MLAFLCTLVFAGAAAVAIGTIALSLLRYGPQVSEIIRASRAVPEMREVSVRIVAVPSARPATSWAQLRRQPRRAIRAAQRPVLNPGPVLGSAGIRATDGPRAAA